MSKVNPVDVAINAAKNKAAEAPATTPATPQNTVDLYRQSGGEVAQYVPARQKTLDDLGASGLNVDAFLKVNEHGLEVKGKDGLIDSITVSIDTNPKGIQIFEGIKVGNPATYYKTYDGAKAVSGGLWTDALKKANMVDPNARTYEGADISMVLLEDAKNVKGAVVAEKGTILGHSTSTTNKANLKTFIDAIKAAGLMGAIVEVRITSEKRTNKAGNTWGVLLFELLGEHNDEA